MPIDKVCEDQTTQHHHKATRDLIGSTERTICNVATKLKEHTQRKELHPEQGFVDGFQAVSPPNIPLSFFETFGS